MKPFDPVRTREVRRRAKAADSAGGGVDAAGANPRRSGAKGPSDIPDRETATAKRAAKAGGAGRAADTAAAGDLAPRRAPGLSRRSALGLAGEPRRSKADEAYLAIRNAIMDGTLAPGAALDKPAICRDLRLSRFPVTAAIARLAYERLVDVEPQRGSFVSRIAASDARELMLVRRGIEVELAGEAARLFDAEAVAALERILRYQQAALAAGDFQDFHRLDHALHDQIVVGLGFGRAGDILEGIRLRVERARRILLPVRGRMGRTYDEHSRVVAAIAARDPDAARAAMRDHLHRVVDEFDVLSRERPDLFAP